MTTWQYVLRMARFNLPLFVASGDTTRNTVTRTGPTSTSSLRNSARNGMTMAVDRPAVSVTRPSGISLRAVRCSPAAVSTPMKAHGTAPGCPARPPLSLPDRRPKVEWNTLKFARAVFGAKPGEHMNAERLTTKSRDVVTGMVEQTGVEDLAYGRMFA